MYMKRKRNLGVKYFSKTIVLFLIGVIMLVSMSQTINAGHPIKLESYKSVFFENKPLTKAIVYSLEQEINKKIEEQEQIRIEEERIRLEEERARLEREKEAKKISDANRKVAYLTFDDGPTRNITPQILDTLDKYDVKATFFVLGKMVDSNPDLVQEIINRGHKIGNHSYSHNYNSMYQSYDSFLAEILRAEKALKGVLGEDYETNLVRFPGGCHGEKKKSYGNRLEKEGYKVYNWNALNGDAEGLNKSISYLRSRFVGTVGNKKRPIILMHDASDKKNTAAYLPEAIEYLKNKGYEFDVLD